MSDVQNLSWLSLSIDIINRIQIIGSFIDIHIETDQHNSKQLNINSTKPILCTQLNNVLSIQSIPSCSLCCCCHMCICLLCCCCSSTHNNPEYNVTWKVNFEELKLNATTMSCTGTIIFKHMIYNDNVFECSMTGSGKVNVYDVKSKKLNVSLIGNGDINFYSSECDILNAEINGCGRIIPPKTQDSVYSCNGYI